MVDEIALEQEGKESTRRVQPRSELKETRRIRASGRSDRYSRRYTDSFQPTDAQTSISVAFAIILGGIFLKREWWKKFATWIKS